MSRPARGRAPRESSASVAERGLFDPVDISHLPTGEGTAGAKSDSAAEATLQHFSVVIPLYNKRKYVRRAVDSVLSQTVRDFELIVVDDGSTDGSGDLLQNISDPRMKLVRQANAGEGAARNRGIAEARADWIAFLDADDMWLPSHLEALSELVERFPHCGLVSTRCLELEDGAAPPVLPRARSKTDEIDYFAKAAANIGLVNSSVAAVNRTAVDRCGGFGPHKAGADLEYWARLALEFPVAISDQVTSVYFRGTGGVMEQIASRPVRRRPPSQQIRLADLSPSLGLLTEALTDSRHATRRASIEAYINSRLFNAIRAALLHREIASARTMAGLAIGRVPSKILATRLILRFPDDAVRIVLELASICRDLVRTIHGRHSRAT